MVLEIVCCVQCAMGLKKELMKDKFSDVMKIVNCKQ